MDESVERFQFLMVAACVIGLLWGAAALAGWPGFLIALGVIVLIRAMVPADR